MTRGLGPVPSMQSCPSKAELAAIASAALISTRHRNRVAQTVRWEEGLNNKEWGKYADAVRCDAVHWCSDADVVPHLLAAAKRAFNMHSLAVCSIWV